MKISEPNISTLKEQTDELFLWYPASRPPALRTDEQVDRHMIVELVCGYIASGEYDHQTKSFWAHRERFENESHIPAHALTPDLIDESLEWKLEESEEVAYWQWLPRRSDSNTYNSCSE